MFLIHFQYLASKACLEKGGEAVSYIDFARPLILHLSKIKCNKHREKKFAAVCSCPVFKASEFHEFAIVCSLSKKNDWKLLWTVLGPLILWPDIERSCRNQSKEIVRF